MNKAVDPVLETLDHQGIPMPPKQIHLVLGRENETPPSYRSVMRAIRSLEDYGMIEKVPDTSYYEITDDGRAYLAGDLDASELDPDD